MRRDCGAYQERLLDLAEGRVDEAAFAHVQTCADCAEILRQYRAVLDAAAFEWTAAPTEAVRRAKDLMMPGHLPQRRSIARLLHSSLLAGARSAPDDIQLTVEAEGERVRLMYSRLATGWEVVGRVPNAGISAERDQGPLALDEAGRFSFAAPSEAQTGFALRGPEWIVEIPSLEELLSNDGPSTH